ncbi:MAG: ketose-bisphosphate aldolase [Corallococcus sp.]|nr:ketose-bisphosphate aldolase [Bacillota bacterium]MCM1533506.1 ketose-bisphosphate aldolase [Corallococcus sp.]
MALVSTKEMFAKAYKEGYAIGAFNVDSVDIMEGVLTGASKAKSPVIIAVSGRMINDVPYVTEALKAASEKYSDIPVALHLDHGKSVDLCKRCVDNGFTSVMIDASLYDFDTNVKISREVADYAHKYGVAVESELGVVSGKEEDIEVAGKYGQFTRPSDVAEFVTRAQIDSLAISIGTCHGAYKYQPGQEPFLRFDILDEIEKLLPDFPLVLHGASSIPKERLDIFNEYGGKLPEAIGIPEQMLRKAAKKAVCKINVASDLRICYFGELRKLFALKPDKWDASEFLAPARQAVADLVYDRLVNVMGSANKA